MKGSSDAALHAHVWRGEALGSRYQCKDKDMFHCDFWLLQWIYVIDIIVDGAWCSLLKLGKGCWKRFKGKYIFKFRKYLYSFV
jgi:hypothetical protein